MWIIRPARKDDLPQILATEKISHPRPWSMKDFETELDGRVSFSCFWIARPAYVLSKVVGYICFRWIIGEVYIINLTVSPDFRRLGVASRLMDVCIKWAKTRNGKKIVLDVRRDNLPAIAFYEKIGFVAAHEDRGRYAASIQSSMVMTLSIGG